MNAVIFDLGGTYRAAFGVAIGPARRALGWRRRRPRSSTIRPPTWQPRFRGWDAIRYVSNRRLIADLAAREPP
jgi:hypothetical protein